MSLLVCRFNPLSARPLKNPAIFTILKKTMDFFEVTGGRVLSFRNVPGSLGTEKKPIVFRSRGVIQRFLCVQYLKNFCVVGRAVFM